MEKCPDFISFHKKHFTKFGFSCHVQKYEFWKIITKENIHAIIINDITPKYRDFIFSIIDGKFNSIPVFCIFSSRNNFRWCQSLLNKFHPQHFSIINSEWFFMDRKCKKRVFKTALLMT
jgi:hypothetical protein